MNPVDVWGQLPFEGTVAGPTGYKVLGEDCGVVEEDLGLVPVEGLRQGLVGELGLSHPVGHQGVVDVILDGVRVLVLGPFQRLDLKEKDKNLSPIRFP